MNTDPVKKHVNADALSRIPDSTVPGTQTYCENYRFGYALEDLPCHGCNYCCKAHQDWARFVHAVDNVVPLSSRPKHVNAATVDAPKCSDCCVTHVDIWPEDGNQMVTVDDHHLVDGFVRVVDVEPVVLVSCELLREEQEKDPQLAHLRCWLLTQRQPSEGTVMLRGRAEKYLWINREIFEIYDGLLCKRMEDNRLLVVPSALQTRVMELNHDLPSAGHAGIDRTTAKMKSKYFWFGMNRDIKNYIISCSVCNQNKKTTKYGKCPMVNYHAGLPMERVHLDFIGPLPRTAGGNEHILMMVDQFTKWVECIPLPSQTA